MSNRRRPIVGSQPVKDLVTKFSEIGQVPGRDQLFVLGKGQEINLRLGQQAWLRPSFTQQ